MSSHRQIRRRRTPGVCALSLSLRERLLLAACVLGLTAAWLLYAASGPGNAMPADGPAASKAGSLTASAGTQPASSPSALPTEGSAGPLSVGETTAPPAVLDPVVLEPAAQGPAASIPQRIIYPAAGMDVVVHRLEPAASDGESRSIVPPETMDGYWLSPFGTPGAGSDNTTYVVGHSWEGLDAPFNRLSSAAAPGDEFTVATEAGVLRYAVESVTTYTKSTLKDSPVWDAVPNRVVLISCYTEDPWGRNVVVVATPARSP